MRPRLFYVCGVIAALLFTLMTVLGGELGPGYSHISETVSELFTIGAPNKLLLDAIHITYAVLMVLFGIGVLIFTQRNEYANSIGKIGAYLFISANAISLVTATFFPQDPWGMATTRTGQMHIILTGVVGFLSILAILCLGIWFISTGISFGFGIYSLLTVLAVAITGVFFATMANTPMMGLAERITILVGFLWTFSLAVLLIMIDRASDAGLE
jgi:hypothetical protein